MSHTCAYCRTSQTKNLCTNCGAPWEPPTKWDGRFTVSLLGCVLTKEFLNGHPPPKGYLWNAHGLYWEPPSFNVIRREK